MTKLSPSRRESLPSSNFGPDESHARNAKARAAHQEKEGSISSAQKKKIDRKADRMLGED